MVRKSFFLLAAGMLLLLSVIEAEQEIVEAAESEEE